ncbi:UNVERIFIED_CONTAM: lysophospholipase L1-like esterase [Acetivibrio alkalicellulosi]
MFMSRAVKACPGLLVLALVLSLLVFPSMEVHAQTITRNEIGTHGGYDYEFWVDNGSGSMTLNAGGAFSCEWSNINNILFRKGRKFNETQTHQQLGNISIRYGVDYNPNGNSYLCVYGWTVDPLVEYYIVDSWGSWRPPGSTSKGQITVDGGTYDIYETTRTQQPSIKGTATFQQYWSVRTSKKTSGTISVSQHFSAWERMGMRMGKMYEVALTIEGYQSSGRANVHTNELTVGGAITNPPTNPTTPTPTTPTMPTNPGPSSRSAFTTIQAEEYNAINSSTMEIIGTGNNGSGIGYIENGNTLTYNNVNFGNGANRFTARVASGADTPTNIEIRLNSATGTLLGTLQVSSTGGWDSYRELSTTISNVTGTNNIVLRFSGPVNIDHFVFGTGGAQQPPTQQPPTQQPPTQQPPTQQPPTQQPPTQQPPTQSRTIKIMPVGDSCTAGMGDPSMGGYRTDLYRHYTNAGLSVRFVGSQTGGPSTLPERNHEGRSGWTIPQVASNIDGWLRTHDPDVVLLWIGGNDMILNRNLNTTGLSNLIDQILRQKPGVTIFVADYYPVPDQIIQYNATIPGVVQQKANAGHKVYFVKNSDMNLVRSTDISSDNLHLSPAGYSKIATIWFNSTIDILKSMVESNPTTPTPTTPPPTTPHQPNVKLGDLNGDGLIDSSDYILLRRYILGVTDSLQNRAAADLNGDGLIDSIDVVLLRRYILEFISEFPA